MTRTEAGLAATLVLGLVLAWAVLAMNPVAPVINARSGGCPDDMPQAGRTTGSDGHGPAGFGLILALMAIVVVGGLVLFAGDTNALLNAVTQPI
jgi:hypothetical protein